MENMTSAARLEAAIATLSRLKAESTSGTWVWATPSGETWGTGEESLLATGGVWKPCPYYCVFKPESTTSRGIPRQPGHEHLQAETVLYGYGYDASGIEATTPDRELIVTLHRTIDAQLGMLHAALAEIQQYADGDAKMRQAMVSPLVEAILGAE